MDYKKAVLKTVCENPTEEREMVGLYLLVAPHRTKTFP